MDITVRNLIPAGLNRQATQVPAAAQPAPIALPKAAPSAPQDQINSQYDAAAQQALISFDNTYAVSDTKFAIFKDAAGKFITRYVSLRDGSVTYTPAPSYVKSVPPQIAIKV